MWYWSKYVFPLLSCPFYMEKTCPALKSHLSNHLNLSVWEKKLIPLPEPRMVILNCRKGLTSLTQAFHPRDYLKNLSVTYHSKPLLRNTSRSKLTRPTSFNAADISEMKRSTFHCSTSCIFFKNGDKQKQIQCCQ